MPSTRSDTRPERTPRKPSPRKDDWLCSKCGQVSNNSEPCYDCDRKEREANPIPPPPPAPDRPTRDTSKKSWPPAAPPQPPQGPYANASRKRTRREERQPSLTSYTVSSPRPKNKPDRQFALWGFIKYKWQSLDEYDREIYIFIGGLFWFIFWMFSGIFAAKFSLVFVIPWIILSLIGVVVFIVIAKHLVKGAWNKYFPEYREFQEEYKSKRKATGEQMTELDDLFESYEDVDRKRGTNHTIGG